MTRDYRKAYEELMAENDRGTVIVAAAMLDDHLRELLKAYLIDDRTAVQELIGKDDDPGDRPLSSFSSRVSACYCLSLISKLERDDINIVRRIRNECAHAFVKITFDDEAFISRIHSMKITSHFPKEVRQSFSIRRLFSFNVMILLETLYCRAEKMIRNDYTDSDKIAKLNRLTDVQLPLNHLEFENGTALYVLGNVGIDRTEGLRITHPPLSVVHMFSDPKSPPAEFTVRPADGPIEVSILKDFLEIQEKTGQSPNDHGPPIE